VTQLFSHIEDDVWHRTARAPNVVRVGDRLRMYYHGERGERRRIGLAETDVSDPFHWEKHPDNPVLDLGSANAIDSHWAGYPWVLPITDTHWHMYYGAWGGESLEGVPERKRYYTTMAESNDGGLTWTRSGVPIIDPNSPFRSNGSCTVIEVDNEYWMYYTDVYQPRSDFYRISISRAVSTALLNSGFFVDGRSLTRRVSG